MTFQLWSNKIKTFMFALLIIFQDIPMTISKHAFEDTKELKSRDWVVVDFLTKLLNAKLTGNFQNFKNILYFARNCNLYNSFSQNIIFERFWGRKSWRFSKYPRIWHYSRLTLLWPRLLRTKLPAPNRTNIIRACLPIRRSVRIQTKMLATAESTVEAENGVGQLFLRKPNTECLKKL